MNNQIREIRREITGLRARMLETECAMHDQVVRDLDCTAAALQLMAMRAEMVALVDKRKALGDRALIDILPRKLARCG